VTRSSREQNEHHEVSLKMAILVSWVFPSIILINPLKAELTLVLLTWRIWWAPNNASRWQMGFNLAFKGLNPICHLLTLLGAHLIFHVSRIRVNCDDEMWQDGICQRQM
jgi:hypothetical protein